jgi:hypothetical protein
MLRPYDGLRDYQINFLKIIIRAGCYSGGIYPVVIFYPATSL